MKVYNSINLFKLLLLNHDLEACYIALLFSNSRKSVYN